MVGLLTLRVDQFSGSPADLCRQQQTARYTIAFSSRDDYISKAKIYPDTPSGNAGNSKISELDNHLLKKIGEVVFGNFPERHVGYLDIAARVDGRSPIMSLGVCDK